ncbi:ParB/RepB/Spo0J family partition protein [Streptomyces sp. NPDC006704]|uniref:ParB/RepB/Spo0J family partition protein n=1 Tax=Streptomyces sp. NPDC006704 TaxID=3364760 RepID=UPI00369AB122
MGDLKVDFPTRETLGSTDNLQYSIRNNEVRDPLIAHPDTLQVVSGFRRLAAARQLRRLTVPVIFPTDAAQACQLVRSHLEAESQHQMPMFAPDRFRLSGRLYEFPKPQHTGGPWRHHDYAGPAVGLSSTILKGLRAAKRDASASGEFEGSRENAQRVLMLMFEALDSPVEGCSAGQAVRRLYGYLKSGDCPTTLAAVCGAASLPSPFPAQTEGREPAPVTPVRKRTQSEIRRGVDTISGACAGLASVCVEDLPVEDIPYLAREIRKNRRILGDVLKSLQENSRG